MPEPSCASPTPRGPPARHRQRTDITERSAYGIVSELADAGYIVKEKDGRRNRCRIQGDLPLGEPVGRDRTIGEVLDLLVEAGGPPGRSRTRS